MTPTCPKCGSHVFKIPVNQPIIVEFTGDDHEVIEDEGADLIWTDNTHVHCNDCGHWGRLCHMVPGGYKATLSPKRVLPAPKEGTYSLPTDIADVLGTTRLHFQEESQ